ncbi:MAG: sigma-70 family RNA polymerase sigma factor [Planctomycetales bacterium]|nr:sigma-70 family RNA polymerase sigma factor [Planctomycetales bacterium]
MPRTKSKRELERWVRGVENAQVAGNSVGPRVLGDADLTSLCAHALLDASEEQALFRRLEWQRRKALRARKRQLRGVAGSEQELRQARSRGMRIRNFLVMSNVRLAVSLSRRYVSPVMPLEALLSVGLTTLIAAVDKFDVERGFRFSTYATRAIMRDLARWASRERDCVSRYYAHGDDPAWQTTPAREDPDSGSSDESDLLTMVKSMMDELDPREQFVLRRRFGLDGEKCETPTYGALGRRLGVSKERARQLAVSGLRKLQLLWGRVETSAAI